MDDARWSISFTAPIAWVPPLVAACAGDPPSAEDLLIAADFFYRGLAHDVANRLIAADRARFGKAAAGNGAATVVEYHAGEPAMPLPTPAAEGRLRVSLARRQIAAEGRAGALVHQRGELEIRDGDRGTGKYVTYQLPAHWTVRISRETTW